MTAQTWDPDRYEKNARFVSDLGHAVVDLLAPRPGERILDLGCGDGALTTELVRRGSQVVAIDASAAFVDAAKNRGLDAHRGDGEELHFAGEFDAVFSNAALHWMRRADAVAAGVHRALKPGGRFVGELGGAGCVRTLCTALVRALDARGVDGAARVPWFFPTLGEYAAILESAGFRVDSMALFPRPTPLPGDVVGWLETFAQTFTAALPPEARADYLRDVRADLEPKLRGPSGVWVADYIRLRFAATRGE